MRTYVQIDVQNLFFSAKDLKRRIDFRKIRSHFVETGHDIYRMAAYIIRTQDAKSDRFEALLRSLEYDLVIKQAIISTGASGQRVYKNTDQDMALCIDCMKNIDKFDKWVLMSGDGDFIDLCKYLKEHGKTIEVWAVPGGSFNKRFCDYADAIFFLNDKFFMDEADQYSQFKPNIVDSEDNEPEEPEQS